MSYWVCKPTNAILADSPSVYTSDNFLTLNTIDKFHLKCDVADGSVVNPIRKPILVNFVLDKPAVYKTICEPETIQNKKVNKSKI